MCEEAVEGLERPFNWQTSEDTCLWPHPLARSGVSFWYLFRLMVAPWAFSQLTHNLLWGMHFPEANKTPSCAVISSPVIPSNDFPICQNLKPGGWALPFSLPLQVVTLSPFYHTSFSNQLDFPPCLSSVLWLLPQKADYSSTERAVLCLDNDISGRLKWVSECLLWMAGFVRVCMCVCAQQMPLQWNMRALWRKTAASQSLHLCYFPPSLSHQGTCSNFRIFSWL